jgi:hypothetical protein
LIYFTKQLFFYSFVIAEGDCVVSLAMNAQGEIELKEEVTHRDRESRSSIHSNNLINRDETAHVNFGSQILSQTEKMKKNDSRQARRKHQRNEAKKN